MSTENIKNSNNVSNKTLKKPKSSKKSHSDKGAFAIALTIILSFIILSFILLVWIENVEYFKDVSAIYGAWVGIAIGYFFGSRKVETLTEKIENYMEFAEMTDNDWQQKYNALEEEKGNVDGLYYSSVQALQYIMAKNPEICPELKESLKTEHGIIV